MVREIDYNYSNAFKLINYTTTLILGLNNDIVAIGRLLLSEIRRSK